MQYERNVTISVAPSRTSINWANQKTSLSELYARISAPARSAETLAEYLAYPKSQQDALKDVGGFVGGSLSGNRRLARNVKFRDIITLDFDALPSHSTPQLLKHIRAFGVGFAVYSTRKNRPEAPRLRVLFPLSRPAHVDEYEALARKMAAKIGIDYADRTTYEPARLMYWPSACADSHFVFDSLDAPLLDVDATLAEYADWHNVADWPAATNEVQNVRRIATTQGDPETKPGLVGAFCRTYNVPEAIDRYLPDVYSPVEGTDRYSYAHGSTTGGAVLYENKFLFSHHATDPVSGRLVNAFDLVRLHLYGELDNGEDRGVNSPSYVALTEQLLRDDAVVGTLNQERYMHVVDDFSGIAIPDAEDDEDPLKKLEVNKKGEPQNTINNVLMLLQHDKNLKGKIAYSVFRYRLYVHGALPWNADTTWRFWCDADDCGLRWYLAHYYRITGAEIVADARTLHAHTNKSDEVRDYLDTLRWDGQPRLDTIYSDYLGAEDNEYTRAVARKALVAAVARTYEPGTKFDYMTIITGAQGIGKSTLLRKLSRGWFNDNIKTFEGKEASEMLSGVLIAEISELEAFNRSEVGRIKQFLSQNEDVFRAAYDRHVDIRPRRCVFFGTSNAGDFIRDKTGGRRFWPIDARKKRPTLDVFTMSDETIDQIWAEACARYRMGECLYPKGEIEAAARIAQEAHREQSPREGMIRDFINTPIPENWNRMGLEERRLWLGGNTAGIVPSGGECLPRERVCALEIWCECFNGDAKLLTTPTTLEINGVLGQTSGWIRADKPMRFGYAGVQRGFVREGGGDSKCLR